MVKCRLSIMNEERERKKNEEKKNRKAKEVEEAYM